MAEDGQISMLNSTSQMLSMEILKSLLVLLQGLAKVVPRWQVHHKCVALVHLLLERYT